jgi:ABC-type antimicrobial peptide transport system permease subunit
VPVFHARTLDTHVEDAVAEPRLYAVLFAAFATTALVLAAVGVYGVVALAVGQRTREIGVRMALGARVSDVVRLVVRQALRPIGLGVLLGLVAALGASRLLASLLFGVSPKDLPTFVLAPLFVGMVGLLAAWAPSRRAASVSPTDALRAE